MNASTKQKVFGLAAVTTITACGLVIDPDALVADRDEPLPGGDGGAPDVVATDGATSAEAGDDGGISVVVPECVPAKPSNAEGPYAVVVGKIGSTLACPSGYLATPVTSGKGDFSSGGYVQCGDATGCGSCGSPSGTAACGLRVRYFDNGSCTQERNTPDTFGSCKDLENESYVKVEYAVTGLTCGAPSSATTTPTSKPTAAFQNQYIVCAPDPSVQTALCKSGQTALPPAANASACVVVPANASCPDNTYPRARDLSKNGTFTDTRQCTCSCEAAGSSCTGGEATLYADQACQGVSLKIAAGTCVPRTAGGNSADSIKTETAPTPSGTTACAPKASASGSAAAQTDVRICCLSSNSGGN